MRNTGERRRSGTGEGRTGPVRVPRRIFGTLDATCRGRPFAGFACLASSIQSVMCLLALMAVVGVASATAETWRV